MYSTEILSNTETIRKVNSTEIDDSVQRDAVTHCDSAELQTSKQTLTTSKHSIELIYLQ